MKLSVALTLGLVALALPRVSDAQGAGTKSREKEIPASSRPPAGMCRVWLDDVPAAQQPAPTDCATAVRNRPAKGRVIFGDDYAAPKRDSSVKGKGAIKGFAPSKPGGKKPDIKRRPPLGLP
jgi:hypothetical protein